MNKLLFLILIALTVWGCDVVPSVNILGAYFPSWLFCMTGGAVFTGLIHIVLRQYHVSDYLSSGMLAVTYCSLSIIIALTGWLSFFKN